MWYPLGVMTSRAKAAMVGVGILTACVPSGSAGPQDAGVSATPAAPQATHSAAPTASIAPLPPSDPLQGPFEDDFDHPVAAHAPVDGAAISATSSLPEPGPDWIATAPGIWHVDGGRLCAEHARNHGIWLKHAIPTNARIEFDAVSQSPDGDLKAEYWGDGHSYATALSYTNATSYLTIFGGWHNTHHVLARINEHATDRKDITVDANSDDPREKPVVAGQVYHFKVERADGKTVRWWVDGNEMLSYPDPAPLVGPGHDHFGFNNWDVKVCFDNVRVVPLP
jgi:hypothetical protein